MISITRLTDQSTSLYTNFKELYTNSFPAFEQRSTEKQLLAFQSSAYHLDIYCEEEKMIGFISYWELKENIYIEHFAIDHCCRGKGYGTIILDEFIAKNKKIIILEIDPIVDDISAARLRFYKRCGFYKNHHYHLHPPYHNGYKPHLLIVLSTQRTLTDDEYSTFNNNLNEVVMKSDKETV